MSDSPASSGSDPAPVLRDLGLRLLEGRRRQGLSQEELADRLRLGTDQLDALEQGDRQRLPEPVFVIAQAKRVAGALGISIENEITAVRRSVLMASPRRSRLATPPAPAIEGEQARPAVPPGRTPSRGLAIAAALLLALGLASAVLLMRRTGSGVSPAPPVAPPPLPAPRP